MFLRLCLLVLAPVFMSCAQDHEPSLPDETGEENPDVKLITPEIRARGMEVRSRGWQEPNYTPEEQTAILEQYQYMDPQREIPENLFKKAVLYYHHNLDLIPNKNYLMVVDFSQHSRKYRLWLLDMIFGSVGAMRTSHGKGSDLGHDGYADSFGNIPNSHKSSLGFFLTGETYSGKHGYSLRLDGLSDTNSNTRDRAIVIHGGSYVKEQDIKQGRSLGCFVLAWENRQYVIDRVKDGALLFAGLSRE